MAIINYYVDPASTPGGTGLTEALTGTDRAFASLYEASQKVVPPLSKHTIILLKRSSSAVDTVDKTSMPAFLGFDQTTNSSYLTISVHPDHRHEGKYADTRASDGNYIYRLEADAEVYAGIRITGDCVTVDGVVLSIKTTYKEAAAGILVAGGHYNVVKNCIVNNRGGYPDYIVTGIMIYVYDGTNSKFINNYVFSDGTAIGATRGFYHRGNNAYSTGNVAYGMDTGFAALQSTIDYFNNVAIGCTSCFLGSANATSSNNLSTDGTAPGTNSLINQIAADNLVDPANGDPTIKACSPAIGAGANLTWLNTDTVNQHTDDDYTLDSAGNARTTWDMGSLLYESAPRQAKIKLFDRGNNIQTNITNLNWAWFDESNLSELSAPKGQGYTGTIDAQGYFSITITDISNLDINDTGFLIVSNTNGTITQSPAPKSFAGPVKIIAI